jgi:hypothetical protein
MNATLAAVRAKVTDQGDLTHRKGILVVTAARGPLIDHERHRIRAGDEWRHLPPELWRVFTAMHAQGGRVIPITVLFRRTGGSLPRETNPGASAAARRLGFEFSLIEASGSNSSSIRPGSLIAARFQ